MSGLSSCRLVCARQPDNPTTSDQGVLGCKLNVIDSAGGTVRLTFEEGTLSQWIYDQVVALTCHGWSSAIRDTTGYWRRRSITRVQSFTSVL